MKSMKYTIKDFQADFPDDDKCLEWLKDYLYPDGIKCPTEGKVTPHHRIKKRKVYSCELCGHHVSPTANTIFHKSSTPLTLWFYAVYLMASTRAGISAKQLERELGVTYKTAWRMFHQIRSMMADDGEEFTGEVEVDETYVGAKANRRSTVKPKSQKPVFGMIQRGGKAKAVVVDKAGANLPYIVKDNANIKATIYSDQYMPYRTLWWMGFKHKTINHGNKEYVRGNVHTQNIENFWSNFKRGLTGVYRHCDPKYLQAYADEYAFRYSHRNDFQPMFWALMNRVSK
jgi:transposase-like protein